MSQNDDDEESTQLSTTTTTFDVSIQSGHHQTHSSMEADRSERLTAAGYSYVEINQRVIIGEREGRPGGSESRGLGIGEWGARSEAGAGESRRQERTRPPAH